MPKVVRGRSRNSHLTVLCGKGQWFVNRRGNCNAVGGLRLSKFCKGVCLGKPGLELFH